MKISDIQKGYGSMNAGVLVGDLPQPLFDGVKLKVRRLWNPDYSALHEKLAEGKPDPLPAADEAEITTECLLQTCLIGWEGVDDPYTPEAARALMIDPEAGSAFRGAVIWAATHVADLVKAQIEADEKN